MTFKKNILSSYLSQLYITSIGIITLPMYIKYMGSEAYGLVGFFAMLQAWFALLDLGLTPTIIRESARYYSGEATALSYRRLIRALSVIFLTIGLLGGAGLFFFAEAVAYRWLKIVELDLEEVVLAIRIMSIIVALRWLGGLYRGVISGAERLIWLGVFNSLIATLRFVLIFVPMFIYGFTPEVFFYYQLVIASVELIGLYYMGSSLLPTHEVLNSKIGWSIKPVKSILKFALSIAFASSVWIFVTQVDKLVLSGVLSLADYGQFTLAVLVASGIMVISGPVSQAVLPRMARLYMEGSHENMINVYRSATQLVSVIAGSAAITIAFLAEPLLFAWTGDQTLAYSAAPILRLYAIANAFLVISSFPYYLQYAIGNLRYHLYGNVILAVLLVPSMIYVASNFGGIGAGYTLLIVNGVFLVGWTAYVHHKLEPGLHIKWILEDSIAIYFPVVVALILLTSLGFPETQSRFKLFIYIALISATVLAIACLSSSMIRRKIFYELRKFNSRYKQL